MSTQADDLAKGGATRRLCLIIVTFLKNHDRM